MAGPLTVCTVTVNSADEREVMKEYLPAERYRFVELAELGRRDWLAAACARKVSCDVLVVSGHFAGTDFYSSKHGDHLSVDEMERVSCSDSCPELFSRLKEVYLFGCDTLKPEPVRSSTPEIVRALLRAGHPPASAAAAARALSLEHGESARDRMRRVFPNVPVIYGFSSLAPYGRVAGPMLRRHFEASGTAEVGSGEPSAGLLRLFGPSSMVATSGQRASDPEAGYRAQACRYYDDRLTAVQRLAFVHEILAGEAAALRMNFDRIERFVAALEGGEQREAPLKAALAAVADDRRGRESYLRVARDTADPALRVRMIGLAARLGWLSAAQERAEHARMIGEMLAEGGAGYGEVDLVCGLNGDRALDSELARFDVVKLARTPANAAALACLGSAESRERMLRAVASADEREVQIAQAYLRHRPVTDEAELRVMVREIARMKPSPAQARALETLARQPLADAQSFDELTRLFASTRSLAVQRAIAEVFLRSRPAGARSGDLARTLRERRIKSPDGHDLIDTLIRRLESA